MTWKDNMKTKRKDINNLKIYSGFSVERHFFRAGAEEPLDNSPKPCVHMPLQPNPIRKLKRADVLPYTGDGALTLPLQTLTSRNSPDHNHGERSQVLTLKIFSLNKDQNY